MDFFIGVFVGGLTVGGIVFAKVMAAKAEANAGSNAYLTGKGRIEVISGPPTRIENGGGL